MEGDEPGGNLLVVDDESSVADVYAARLELRYEAVRTAYGGEAALDALEDDPTTDVVLLDRRMPDLSGDEVLDELRERGYDCRVIMVTAVDADFDLLQMPFDDYLQKPLDKEDLYGAVDQQLAADSYDQQMSEFYSVTSKLSVLEAEKSAAELEENEEYRRLRERADRLEAELDDTVDEFDDLAAAFTSISRS